MGKIHIHMVDLKSYYLSPAYQLGLLVSYACLEEAINKNIEFTFTEHPREHTAKEIVDTVMSTNADLIAMTNYAWNYNKICEVLDILSSSQAKLPWILLGGPNSAGAFGTKLMKRYPIISAIVEAEGEPAFQDICASLVDSPSKDPFIDSRNCVIRGEDGEITRSDMNHRIEYLDEVPSPYLTGILPVEPSPVFYETNRGCPYRCSFCYWGNGNSRIYRMSLDRIREEVDYFAKNRVYAFWLADANFGIFPEDAEIAEILAEVNSRYGYPIKSIGVNWAKNSSDRVLDIVTTFKRGRISTTATLALQSVTSEAEDKSRRYSMPPSRFVNLVSAAEEKDIDTYTDIIWGLPGENIEEYLDGLDAVISSGVPAIWVRQLYLLPGTQFFDGRQEFGLKMLKETDVTAAVNFDERHDYCDYIVVSHPKMSREEMIRGSRIMGVNHLLHNHDLGRVVDFYLARYGIKHSDVYTFFDEVIVGQMNDFPQQETEFLNKIRKEITYFARSVGIADYAFYRKLSDVVWYKRDGKIRNSNMTAVRKFMHDFYRAFCQTHDICTQPEEKALLSDMIDYNVLVSPKPTWKPDSRYEFQYDIDAIWHDMLKIIHNSNGFEGGMRSENGDDSALKLVKDGSRKKEDWAVLSKNVRTGLAALLSDTYLEKKRGPVTYKVNNPWRIPPAHTSSDWLPYSRSKHCIVNYAN